MPLQPGDKLGPYEILAPIGAGGMGEVWKARDTRLNRIVAVKRLKAKHSARFEQEARAIAALNHPYICQIFDIGPDYLVLEYIEGHALKGPLPVEGAVRVATQIAEALDAAHRKGVVHRDLKPANIMVTAEGPTQGSIKLLDFGLAKQVADAGQTETMEGTVMGTAAYMAPEQAEGKPLDARSDVFSFGAVLYELLSGRRAFRGENSISTMAAILHKEPAPLDAPAGLQQIVKKCLAKAPGQRYQTMAEIQAALEEIAGKLDEQGHLDEKPSVAVLPFANMSRDPDDEFFSDGLAEEILNVLAQIAGLKVIARTSAFAFKGKNEDIRKIAEALGATNLLEGSVRRAGNRLRITAQLIHAADGTHLWSQRYDREMTDVFAVQDEIAAAIAGALEVKLTGKANTPRVHEPSLAAYEAFLKGRHQFQKASPEAFARAEEYLKQAIELDPQWADSQAHLGALHFSLAVFGVRPLIEMVPLARAEARKALELLPSHPMAHAVLGAIAAVHDYDWKEAEEQFRLAMAPGSVPGYVHLWYSGFYLSPLGRFEEAIQEQAKAVAQDPLNVVLRGWQAAGLLHAGRYELAIAAARKAQEFERRAVDYVLAMSYFSLGKLDEAREWAEEAYQAAPWSPMAVAMLAGLLARAGEKERAEKLFAELHGNPVGMILYHFICSEIDAALDWYERSIELRQPGAAAGASAAFYKPLRSSPRWPKLAKMMNLPETTSQERAS